MSKQLCYRLGSNLIPLGPQVGVLPLRYVREFKQVVVLNVKKVKIITCVSENKKIYIIPTIFLLALSHIAAPLALFPTPLSPPSLLLHAPSTIDLLRGTAHRPGPELAHA